LQCHFNPNVTTVCLHAAFTPLHRNSSLTAVFFCLYSSNRSWTGARRATATLTRTTATEQWRAYVDAPILFTSRTFRTFRHCAAVAPTCLPQLSPATAPLCHSPWRCVGLSHRLFCSSVAGACGFISAAGHFYLNWGPGRCPPVSIFWPCLRYFSYRGTSPDRHASRHCHRVVHPRVPVMVSMPLTNFVPSRSRTPLQRLSVHLRTYTQRKPPFPRTSTWCRCYSPLLPMALEDVPCQRQLRLPRSVFSSSVCQTALVGVKSLRDHSTFRIWCFSPNLVGGFLYIVQYIHYLLHYTIPRPLTCTRTPLLCCVSRCLIQYIVRDMLSVVFITTLLLL
jgi:hypothetical protein